MPSSQEAIGASIYMFSRAEISTDSDVSERVEETTQELMKLLSRDFPPGWSLVQRPTLLAPRVARYVLQGTTAATAASIYDIRRSKTILGFEQETSCEVVILPFVKEGSQVQTSRRTVRLAVFDMDSTLIEQEVIDELARFIGRYSAVAAITESAMRGEIDFAESLKQRVLLLRGVSSDIWEKMKPRISFANGARELCKGLAALDVKMAVLSGGFTPMAEYVKSELGLHVVHANFLETAPANEEFAFEHLTGHLVADQPIITATKKRELLLDLAQKHSIPLSQVLCVGDGANDLEMLNAVGDGAGVGIAFKAKPRVQVLAPNRLNSQSLLDILHLFGYSTEEVDLLARGERPS